MRLPIKNWSNEDKPREKLIAKGKEALSNAELIAILLRSGTTQMSAVQLAADILNKVDNQIDNLSKMTIGELTKFNGIGEAKALSIIAALELGRRRLKIDQTKKIKVTTSKIAFEYFYPILIDAPYEQFWALFLRANSTIICSKLISDGGISKSFVDIKKVFKYAIDNNATKIILCHNHPSGNLTPSDEDINLTKKIVAAGKILNLNILDHIIINENDYYSFAENENIL